MRKSTSELANLISRSLITASTKSFPTRTWTPQLEQTLHQLVRRDSLNSSLVARVIDPFLLNHHSLAYGFFNWASQQPGFSHSSISYQSLFKSLSISRQFNDLDKVFSYVKLKNIKLDPCVYGSIMHSYIVSKKTQKAFLIFKEMGCGIGVEVCNLLLAALASDGNLRDARKVFDEMFVRGVEFSILGVGVFLWRFCRNGELSEVLRMLDEVRKIGSCSGFNGSVLAVLVVHGLCLECRVEEAVYVLDELRGRDCKPDFMAYRIVAETVKKVTGDVVEVEKVLKKKRKFGVAPRGKDYKEFIFALISERMICEAKDLGEIIVSGNFPVEEDVLNALIGSVSSIDPCSAIYFMNFMLEKQWLPAILTMSNLSRSLCKHGKIEELLEVFEVLSAKEYFVDSETYNLKVSFLCKAGRVREAYQVFQEMKKKGLSPDVSLYNSLMEACCREDLIRPAKRLWDEMFANGCEGNLKTYNILIGKFSKIGQAEEAHRIFHKMQDKGVKPDTTTYLSLLEGLCEEKEIKTALEVFIESINQDATLAWNVLNSFVLFLCKEGYFSDACELLRGRYNDVKHANSHAMMLKCMADSGELALAIEHMKWVSNNSPSVLHAVVAELLASLSSSTKPDLLRQIIQSG
ncbi:Pentatricopeptide repeat-containing protein [Heracleum sosnowskyi]|uniref:Pentatricopeptide repeat-containing protein n=1 Tax=Heracleum sosnowskyi TaxID=360622 RepID=A0AAD8H1Q3_9APIA|nr:Pentatricopeptide repeat-containing protein [Heracleum sosnowskyi]